MASKCEKTVETEISPINFYRSKVFQALADPIRLGIIEFLGKDERCVCEIVAAFPRGQSTISCLLYTSPSPRDLSTSRMPSSA